MGASEVIDAKTGLMVRADRAGAVTFSFRYRAGSARRRIDPRPLSCGVAGRGPRRSRANARAGPQRSRPATGKARGTAHGAEPSTPSPRATSSITPSDRKPRGKMTRDICATPAGRGASGMPRSITRQDAARLLFDVVAVAPVSANRLRSVLVKLFGWAVDSGLLTDKPDAPAIGRARAVSKFS